MDNGQPYSSEGQPEPLGAPTVEQVFKDIAPRKSPLKPTIAERQEETRGDLAKGLIGILRLTIIFFFLLIVADRIVSASIFSASGQKYEYNSSESKEITTLILTSLTGLVGTALGFYFGSRNSFTDSRRDD